MSFLSLPFPISNSKTLLLVPDFLETSDNVNALMSPCAAKLVCISQRIALGMAGSFKSVEHRHCKTFIDS